MDQQSSIILTKETHLSLLYIVLKTLIRPLRPRLIKPKGELPAGSPELKPPKLSSHVQHHQSDSINLYTFQPPNPPSTLPRNHIYYFAGGAWTSPPSKEHWKSCSELAIRLKTLSTITLVSYPLQPHSPAPQSLPMLRTWLATTCSTLSKGDTITLAGDSAGGNVVLSLALWWAEHHLKSSSSQPSFSNPLSNLLLISPACDLSHSNPAIKQADKLDPVLSIDLSHTNGSRWAADWGVNDPAISPVRADLSLLKRLGVKVHGILGTADILSPDALVVMERLKKEGTKGEWLVWEGQMHCFPLAWVYGLPEGKRGFEWIEGVLRRNV